LIDSFAAPTVVVTTGTKQTGMRINQKIASRGETKTTKRKKENLHRDKRGGKKYRGDLKLKKGGEKEDMDEPTKI